MEKENFEYVLIKILASNLVSTFQTQSRLILKTYEFVNHCSIVQYYNSYKWFNILNSISYMLKFSNCCTLSLIAKKLFYSHGNDTGNLKLSLYKNITNLYSKVLNLF